MKTLNRAAVIIETFELNRDDIGRRFAHGAQHLEYLARLPLDAQDCERVTFHHEPKVRGTRTVREIVGTWRGQRLECGVLPR